MSRHLGRSLPFRNPSIELSFPEQCWQDWLIATLIFFTAAFHFSLFYKFLLLNADEGIVLEGAQRIIEGEVLYRDFFSFVTPGSYYWMSLFFRLFGSSILVGRMVLLIEAAVLSIITYLISRRVCSRWSSLFAAMLVTLTGLPNRFLVLHNWDSTLWTCLALYCTVLFIQRQTRVWLAAAGWFVALTCLFEQSKGAGIVLGLGLAVLILGLTGGRSGLWKMSFAIALAIGFSAPFLFTFAYFATQHSFYQMLADWLWPFHNYSAVNATSYGFVVLSANDRAAIYDGPLSSRLLTIFFTSPWFIIPAVPLIGAGALIYWTQSTIRTKSCDSGQAYYIVISAAVVGLLCSVVATGRADFTHLIYLSPIFFVVLAWIMDGKLFPFALRKALPLVNFFLLLSFLGFGLILLSQPLNATETISTRRGTLKGARADEVVDYIQHKIPAGEKVLVYPYLPLYYYLTETHGPGRYEYLMPGFHTSEQFREFVHEIDAEQPRMVFFQPSFREELLATFPAASAQDLHQPDPVAEYIRSHYRTCANLTSQNFWRFTAMVRNDLQCP